MSRGPSVILGGAGFVGSNLASRLLSQGATVRVFDDLSRIGVERNVDWLRNHYDGRFELHVGDVRDERAVSGALANASEVYHLAAQVSVATSFADPQRDFDVNARGTLNVLETLREQPDPPPLFFTSTSEVYGSLERVSLEEGPKRYQPRAGDPLAAGISEAEPLEFHTPHGCSKGAADQYVIGYARSFGLRAIVFRTSSVYGPRQCGNEDHGWITHVLRRSLSDQPVTVFGTGKQVRDVLFVDDLVDAFLLARQHLDELWGSAFNIGGGPANTLSVLELLDIAEELGGGRPEVVFSAWRPGERRYYVSDVRGFGARTGWTPRTDVRKGLRELYLWLSLPYEKRRSSFAPAETRP